MYSEIVKDHFMNPRNVGEIKDASGIGEVGNPVCGDMMTVFVKVDGGVLSDVKFKTFGCGAAIAVSSMVTEMAKGKTVEEALKIRNSDVAKALGGLPKNKLHCSNLGADALHEALLDYQDRQAGRPSRYERKKQEELIPSLKAHEHEKCTCPYCDIEVSPEDRICKNCGQELEHEEP